MWRMDLGRGHSVPTRFFNKFISSQGRGHANDTCRFRAEVAYFEMGTVWAQNGHRTTICDDRPDLGLANVS